MSLTLSSTAGSDYKEPIVNTVTFGSGVTRAPYPIPIVDDGDVESTESFAAVLTTTESDVIIGDGTAFVNVLDDDRKLFLRDIKRCRDGYACYECCMPISCLCLHAATYFSCHHHAFACIRMYMHIVFQCHLASLCPLTLMDKRFTLVSLVFTLSNAVFNVCEPCPFYFS